MSYEVNNVNNKPYVPKQNNVKANSKQSELPRISCFLTTDPTGNTPPDFIAECGQIYSNGENVNSVEDFLLARSNDKINGFTANAMAYFNTATTDEKYEILAIEFAKNKFLYQKGSNLDEQVKKWNSLSDEERNQLIEQAKETIDRKSSNCSKEDSKRVLFNIVMEDIQTANSIGQTYEEFDESDNMIKKDIHRMNYLESLEFAAENMKKTEILNKDQKMRLKILKENKEAVIDYIRRNTSGEEQKQLLEQADNWKTTDIMKFCKEKKLHPFKLHLEYLQNKQNKNVELTVEEKKQLEFLEKSFNYFKDLEPVPEGTITAYTRINESEYADKFKNENNPKLKSNILYKYILENCDKDDISQIAEQVDLAIRDAISNHNYALAQELFTILSIQHPNWTEIIKSDTERALALVNNADGVYSTEQSASLNQCLVKTNDEHWIHAATESTGKRTDALDVYEIANKLIAEDEDITNDARKLFAQYSIESLSTPEAQNIQANNLRSYNLESFNTGAEQGLQNVSNALNTTSGSHAGSNPSASNQNFNTSAKLQTNPITQSSVTSQAQVQNKTSYEQFKNGEISVSEFAKSFNDLTKSEKEQILKSLPSNEVAKMPINICADCPEFIDVFVNAGRGIEIIEKVADAANQAIRCMKRSEDNKIREQLNEYIINHPAQFMKISLENARTQLGLDKKNNTAQKNISYIS